MPSELVRDPVVSLARHAAMLERAFARQDLRVPSQESLPPDDVPEPYHRLLVHDSDMTSTLKRFHRDDLVLSVLNRDESDNAVEREVVLCRASDGYPVEYGVIHIELSEFSDDAKKAIAEGALPLGQILDAHEVPYLSRPSRFFKMASSPYLTQQLRDADADERYGRVNTLTTPHGAVLAEVMEVLPRLPLDSAN